MSVLVTTTFSQGAVFYAGETLSCTIAFTNPIHNNTNNTYPSKPIKPSVPAPVLSTFSQQHRKNTRSISSLASSTLAFLTRTSTPMTEDEQPVIPIELDSPTPRSSIDTFVQHQPSPRSSIDSNTSFRSRRYSNSPLKRLTSEHLMCGFAQVVGSFIADSNLINLSEFDPLKRHTMYTPQGGFGGGGGLMMAKTDSSLDTRTLPVFSTPPSILFVDLDLAPGETKKFSYKIQLPNDIPPSHRGKTIRFNYYLVVGTQSTKQQQGQVVQIRFRVLNHVAENGSRPIYDLMNPVVRYKDEAIVVENTDQKRARRKKQPEKLVEDRMAFLDYVNELYDNTHQVHEITRRESEVYESSDDDEEDQQIHKKSCSQIVSRITHQSRKAMFDLCKNNQRIAKLHLVKTAHRLGEPVVGVLDFSEATLSTFKISVFLESSESVEDTIALRTPQHINRVSKKTHSDFHSFCLDHKRLSFSLPIPATASPEFQTTGVSLVYFLRFEFITSIDNQAPFIPIIIDEKHRHHQCLQDVEVSTFDCQIPLTVYGSPGGVDRALFGRPHTFRV
ncbi:Rgp1-domain-containing protein [Choanephora cucurbitarum]|nr:Rgp1-domain-containing protein [Choanephora cucurbitarum]